MTRRVVYSMMVSLDGFVEDADGGIGWSEPDEELHRYFNDQEAHIDAHLYGRRLYRLMADHWPTADEDPSAADYEIAYARTWKSVPKIVFSRTLESVDWNSRLVREELAEEVARLKSLPGKDMDLGGPGLAASFMRLGLIDEYQLFVHPVVLGSGKPYFPPGGDRQELRLLGTRTFGSGVVLLRYRPELSAAA
ncbi:dihydrofolate reductase family protein [Streptomyces sp. ACA25]|uniref:dihydrofolate reductase family protein n=1 Tax=Streptomyces sp. ACA25 TaxID=3022596 RepID=UPI002307BD02|nr:dihydrofolate reductase family protein [Streptomyces sp. ACA25]MDB1090214.1 dihydrofolate reductase family protein [Streptomyces sp. ACA25]